MKNVLLTGAGGGGTNNLYRDILESKLNLEEYTFFGSNISKQIIAKSEMENNFILPVATNKKYLEKLNKLIRENKIDLIIPNNDREVGVISANRAWIDCKVFLPEEETIEICQDKYLFYNKLKHKIPMADSIALNSYSEIAAAMKELGGEKFWVRPRVGAGSKGACWVETEEQAINFIKLWEELRGFDIADYTISKFLPGRDFCFQSVWKDGRLVVAKMCERLSYFGGENRISGMSSTPAVAKTVFDQQVYNMLFEAVYTLTDHPHGNFNFDLKGTEEGEMCVTECNVGRFCMITPIFDLSGNYSTVEYYIRSAFNEKLDISEVIDYEKDVFMLRELDTLPTIIRKQEIEAKSKII